MQTRLGWCMKGKVNILAKPHPYSFFILQLDSMHCLRAEPAPSMQLLVLCTSTCILHTDYYDQSAAHSSLVYRGVYNGATVTTSSMLAIKLLGSYYKAHIPTHTYTYLHIPTHTL